MEPFNCVQKKNFQVHLKNLTGFGTYNLQWLSNIVYGIKPNQTGVVVFPKIPSMSQIELFDHLTVSKQMTAVKLLVLYSNTWYHLTVCKWIRNIELLDLNSNT